MTVQAELRQQAETLPEQSVGLDEVLRSLGSIGKSFPRHHQHVRIGINGGITGLLQEGVRGIDIRDADIGELPELTDSDRGSAGGEKRGGEDDGGGGRRTTR